MSARSTLCLEFGASHVACGVFAATDGARRTLTEFALAPIDADPALDAGWVVRAAAALAEVTTRIRARGEVAMVVPGHAALTKTVRAPRVRSAQKAAVIAFEASQAIPFPLDEVAWEHEVLAEDEAELTLRFTAVKLAILEPLCAAARAQGLRVTRTLPAGVALLHGATREVPATAPELILDLGARSTTLLLAARAGAQVRMVPLGGNTLTLALAAEAGIEFADAERRKIAGDPGIAGAREKIGAQLGLEIGRFVAQAAKDLGTEAPGAVRLTGGAARTSALREMLERRLGVPVSPDQTLARVPISERAAEAGARDEADRLAALVAMAEVVARRLPGGLGLLPPAIRAEREFWRRQPWLLGAAVLTAVALVPPLWSQRRLARLATALADEVAGRLAPLRALADRNAANLKRIESAQGQIARIRTLTTARTHWREFLADLQARLATVDDVWLDEMSIAARPMAAAAAVREAAGEARVQLTIAGRLLDVEQPRERVSPESCEKMRRLTSSLAASPWVAAVREDRFDNAELGLLRFVLTLELDPRHAL